MAFTMKKNISKVQAYVSVVCGEFSIGFIDFIHVFTK